MIDIDKVANRLQSYKQLQKLLDAHETKTDSIALSGFKDRNITTT